MSDEKRPIIGPQPTHPTPWRLAEMHGGHRIIVCAEGDYTGEIPNDDLAELICRLVNEAAERGVMS